jgi:hypothetical protein
LETGAGFDGPTPDWESAAQEAAFDGLCFRMIRDGRFVNRQAMTEGTPHRSQFSLSERVLGQFVSFECTRG